MEITPQHLQKMVEKKTKLVLYPTDIDLIYAATNKDTEFALKYFGEDRYKEFLERVKAALEETSTEGIETDMLTVYIYSILVESLLNPELKGQLIARIGEDTFNAALKQVRDYFEPYMKKE